MGLRQKGGSSEVGDQGFFPCYLYRAHCNYTECLHSISRNNDVVYHQNGVKISLSEGNLHHKSTQISSGGDKFGSYVQIFQEWAFENQLVSTSVRNYENMAIFTQHYPAGLKNVSLGNHVITKTNFPLIAKHPPIIPSLYTIELRVIKCSDSSNSVG